MALLRCCFLFYSLLHSCNLPTSAEPLSKPYIAYRTDPLDQAHLHHALELHQPLPSVQPRPYQYDEVSNYQCPLQMTLGIAQGMMHVDRHESIHLTPPVLVPLSNGAGSQVIYTTNYEHLHLLQPGYLMASSTSSSQQQSGSGSSTNSYKERLVEPAQFPLLMESSAYLTSPVLHDVNGDGFIDALLLDYDGGLTMVGLQQHQQHHQQFRQHAQVPRLFVRREWIASLINSTTTASNETQAEEEDTKNTVHDPFHSYFEYYYDHPDKQQLIRGESANVLTQNSQDAAALNERRKQISRKLLEQKKKKRRLEEVQQQQQDEEDIMAGHYQGGGEYDDVGIPDLDETDPGRDDMMMDDDAMMEEADGQVNPDTMDDPAAEEEYPYDDYRHYDDAYGRYGGDDMYSNDHNEYYDTKHYVRITPHVLSTPVLAEVPKQYTSSGENEDILYVAVSYYLDEDEFEDLFHYKRFEATDEGQENEVRRGGYVANAIMAYVMSEYGGRWTGQTHLDLSTDYSAPENATLVGSVPIQADTTQMIAMSLASPTVVDIDGDGNLEVIIGTSMGFLYVLDARQMSKREFWPVQMPRPVEHHVVVEDVTGNTNLELFVADIGGNVVCLNHMAEVLWHRNWVKSLQLEATTIEASSPLVLGDVNGDGHLDLVQVVRIQERILLFAVQASTGTDLRRFPMELDGSPGAVVPAVHQKLAQPLLVDLHADQRSLQDYIRRNGTAWTPVNRRKKSRGGGRPHGGSGAGLHIVVPVGEEIFAMEGATGCTQKVSIGEAVSAMVQTDDVHGTGQLDLVVATEAGNIITFESQAPFHPLNTWTGGHVRKRGNNHAHGYSASQGIFVHETSRQLADIFGVYVPVTFEVFDNRPGVAMEPDRRKYSVTMRDGPSSKRVVFRKEYTEPGVYTERVYIPYGPGYYTLSVTLLTSHGILYEDQFAVGYNLGFLDGFGVMLWLPLLVASTVIFVFGSRKSGSSWDDEDLDNPREGQHVGGILGATLPT